MSARSPLERTLTTIAALIGVGLLARGIYILESRRDLTLLKRAGASVAQREDGTPLTVHLSGKRLDDQNLMRLGRLASVSEIILERGTCTDAGIRALVPLSRLKQLTLNQCGWFGDDAAALLSQMTKLQLLALTGTSLTDAGLHHLLSLKDLVHLDLTNNRQLTARGIARLAELPRLRYLRIQDITMSIAESKMLRESMPDVTVFSSPEFLAEVQPLVERGVEIGGSSEDGTVSSVWLHTGSELDEPLRRVISNLPDLTLVSSEGSRISDDDLRWLGGLAKLRTLYLIDEPVSAQGLRLLVDLPLERLHCSPNVDNEALKYLGQVTSLTTLSVDGPVTDDGIAHLTELDELRHLSFGNSRITGSQVQRLSTLPKLTSLGFSRSPFDDPGLMKLADFPALQQVTLYRTDVTIKGISAFRARRPGVTLHGE